jgi:hypothetical protein
MLGNFLYNHLLIIKIFLLPEESHVGITRHFGRYMYFSITLMLLFYFRFSSHLIENSPFRYRTFHECFVSSADAMIGGQAARFSESTAFIRRITCNLLLPSALSGAYLKAFVAYLKAYVFSKVQ